jgi:hypothetical protein
MHVNTTVSLIQQVMELFKSDSKFSVRIRIAFSRANYDSDVPIAVSWTD